MAANLIKTKDDLTKVLSGSTSSNCKELLRLLDDAPKSFSIFKEFGIEMINEDKLLGLSDTRHSISCRKEKFSYYKIPNKHSYNPSSGGEVIKSRLYSEFSDGIPLHALTIIDFSDCISDVIEIDVLLAPRYSATKPERNFPFWGDIIKHLLSLGLKVGTIGSKGESYRFDQVEASYNFADMSRAVLGMMAGCKIFIGGDSGPTHLFHNFLKPAIILRVLDDKSPNLVKHYPIVNERCFHYERRLEDWSMAAIRKSMDAHLSSF